MFQPPRLYGLCKIHEERVPLKPTVSNIGAHTYKLPTYLAGELSPTVGRSSHHVSSSTEIVHTWVPYESAGGSGGQFSLGVPIKRLRWFRGSVLVFGTQVRRFKPGRSHRIFQGEKILSTPSFGREVKPFVPCRIFASCKRNRKCMRGSRSFRSKLPAISRPSSSSFHY